MNEEKKVFEDEEDTEVETEETEREGVLTKAGKFVKRNWKRAVTGVAVVAGLGVAYALGKNSSGEDSDEETEVYFEDTTDEAASENDPE